MANDITPTLKRLLGDYTWLILDVFVFIILLALFLGYKDYDYKMQGFLRSMLVFSLWIFSISGFHLLVFLRLYTMKHDLPAREQLLPWWISYPLFLMKPAVIGIFFWWVCYKGYL